MISLENITRQNLEEFFKIIYTKSSHIVFMDQKETLYGVAFRTISWIFISQADPTLLLHLQTTPGAGLIRITYPQYLYLKCTC